MVSLVFGLLFGLAAIAFLGGQTLGETDRALLWIAPTLVLGLAVLLVGIGRLRTERPTQDEESDLDRTGTDTDALERTGPGGDDPRLSGPPPPTPRAPR